MRKFCLAIAAVLLFALPQHAQSLEGAGVPYAITNVTVIDTTGGPAHPNMTVVIDGNRISYVGKAHFHTPKQAHIIDGGGKYLIPGLWDMHIHTFFGDWVPGRLRRTPRPPHGCRWPYARRPQNSIPCFHRHRHSR